MSKAITGKKGRRYWKVSKNCDRMVELQVCAGKLFHAAGASIENELLTQRRYEWGTT